MICTEFFSGAITTQFCLTYTLEGVTAMPRGLHARLCQTFLVQFNSVAAMITVFRSNFLSQSSDALVYVVPCISVQFIWVTLSHTGFWLRNGKRYKVHIWRKCCSWHVCSYLRSQDQRSRLKCALIGEWPDTENGIGSKSRDHKTKTETKTWFNGYVILSYRHCWRQPSTTTRRGLFTSLALTFHCGRNNAVSCSSFGAVYGQSASAGYKAHAFKMLWTTSRVTRDLCSCTRWWRSYSALQRHRHWRSACSASWVGWSIVASLSKSHRRTTPERGVVKSRDLFIFWTQSYLQNCWSKNRQILYTGGLYQVLAWG